jgi:hypothetical protein
MRVVVFLYLVLSAGCATFQTEYEHLDFKIEPGWKVGSSDEIPNQYSIIEFIREGDDINNWGELLTIENSLLRDGYSLEDSFNSYKASLEAKCPGAITWTVIGKDEKSILYEWQAKPCLGWPAQHEIARIIHGKYNRFHLRHTVKTYQMPSEQRAKWVQRFSEAKIETSLR